VAREPAKHEEAEHGHQDRHRRERLRQRVVALEPERLARDTDTS